MQRIINKIDKESLERGDHIYCYRKGYLYSHHGIFIGEDRVIHFNRTKEGNTSRRVKPCQKCGVDKNHLRGVVKSCVDCFLNGRSLRRFRYGVSHRRFATNNVGTCTTGDPDSPDVTISRANDLFNKKDFGDYDLVQNNCETFAVFCKTGKRRSDQASTAILLIKGAIESAIERLYEDVSTHHGEGKLNELKQAIDRYRFFGDVSIQPGEEELNKFKQMIDRCIANRSSPDEISDGLKNLEKDQEGH
ncbi:protein LEAD-SENSITIVE 1 [Rosa sericea]